MYDTFKLTFRGYYMIQIITASHGPLSEAIIKSASIIAGSNKTKNLRCIQITMETTLEEIRNQINEILDSFDETDEILALTDVFGGSITRVITEYIGVRKLHIITGMNLGMLLEALFVKDNFSIEELVDYLLHSGKEGIKCVNAELNNELGGEI